MTVKADEAAAAGASAKSQSDAEKAAAEQAHQDAIVAKKATRAAASSVGRQLGNTILRNILGGLFRSR